MTGLFFDDMAVGQVFVSASHTVTHDEIVGFASTYDPNAFHLDDVVARSLGLKGVIASGFHTLSLSFRLFFDMHLWDEAILPSPGIDNVQFLKPVYPGHVLNVRATVLGASLSKSKPDRGLVRMTHETFESSSPDPVLTVEAMHRLRCRDPRSTVFDGRSS